MIATNPSKTEPIQYKKILAGSVGNLIEWFDWTIYAAFAIFFSSQFFPPGNETAALLATFAVFAVGFFMRPVGGWLIGLFSDRFGRRNALALTIVMMAVGSLIIGITPTYESIGLVAPLLLVLARLIQGLSLGGEYASATTYLTEIAPNKQRGFYSSFLFMSAALGILCASGLGWILTTTLSKTDMNAWGWRIPFIIGAVGGVVGIWIRQSIAKDDAKNPQEKAKVVQQPLRTLIRDYPIETLRIIGFSTLSTYAFYVFMAYLPTYAIRHGGADPKIAFGANTVAIIFYMLMQPFFGYLSDKIGRKPQLITFALGNLLFFYFVMQFVNDSFVTLLLIEMFGLTLYAMYSSIAPAIMAEQFPSNIRAVGIGTPYNLMVAILGGTTPYLLTWLQSIHMETIFYFIVLVAALISLITFIKMPETAGSELQ